MTDVGNEVVHSVRMGVLHCWITGEKLYHVNVPVRLSGVGGYVGVCVCVEGYVCVCVCEGCVEGLNVIHFYFYCETSKLCSGSLT